jgi:hypothetical protein
MIIGVVNKKEDWNFKIKGGDPMKITIEIPDIKTAADAINNAMVAYGDIVSSIILCCEIPNKLRPLAKLDEEELTKRFNCLCDIYKQIEEIEKSKEV